jgi:hypothetical protein
VSSRSSTSACCAVSSELDNHFSAAGSLNVDEREVLFFAGGIEISFGAGVAVQARHYSGVPLRNVAPTDK